MSGPDASADGSPASRRRRHWLVGGVAAAAALAGAGIAWRHAAADRARSAADAEAEAALWALRLANPAGGDLVMSSFRGRPLLLNFWATWCAPCLKEMPLLDAFSAAHAASGWHVVGLAIDSPTPVRQYLLKLPIRFPVGLAGMEGAELTRGLGNPAGSLPFSVVFDRQGRVVERKLGQVKPDDLQRWSSQIT